MNDENKQLNDENKQLTDEPKNPIIELGNEGKAGAGENPEDTYRKVIEGQKSTIDMLMEQVESLNGQIARLVRTQGTSADEGQNPDTLHDEPQPMPENYVYLKDLGSEIGKR